MSETRSDNTRASSMERAFRRWNPRLRALFYFIAVSACMIQASGRSPISNSIALAGVAFIYGLYVCAKALHKQILRALRRDQGRPESEVELEIEELYPPSRP